MRKKILILILLIFSLTFINFTTVKADTNLPCIERKDSETACEDPNYGYACVWNETKYGDYCNVDNLIYVTCGDATDIPYQVPGLISFAVNLLKIATPVILIIVSIVSLLKALASSNEDEIKKAQKSLIRKIAAAVLVFFVISIVQFVIMKVADNNEKTSLSDCLSCFLNNSCEENVYYKTSIGGEYLCTKLKDKTRDLCETFNINSNSSNEVDTVYYKGPKAKSCNGKYSGYKPTSIKYKGVCYELTATLGTGIDYTIVQETLDGELITLSDADEDLQKIQDKDGNVHYFYWNESKNKYVEINVNDEVITPNYQGKRVESCNGTYFKNNYQPQAITPFKNISMSGTSGAKVTLDGCYNLKIDSSKVYISNGTYYSIYKVDNKNYSSDSYRYYWDEAANEYKYLDAENNVYTRFYQGPKLKKCASEFGYFDNGYQPRGISDNGKCYKLEGTGEYHAFEEADLLGGSEIRKHQIWKANNKCYYWSNINNNYIEIECP